MLANSCSPAPRSHSQLTGFARHQEEALLDSAELWQQVKEGVVVSARGQLGHTQPLLGICHCDCPLCLLALCRDLGITWARGLWARGLCLLHSLFLRQSLIVIDLCHGLGVRGWRHGGLQCLHVTCQHSMVTCDDVFSANNNPLVTCCHAHDVAMLTSRLVGSHWTPRDKGSRTLTHSSLSQAATEHRPVLVLHTRVAPRLPRSGHCLVPASVRAQS